ncbi:MAG: DNA polymerase [Gemmatimonadota bacterium]
MIAVDTETTLIIPRGTEKVNTRAFPVPDLVCTTWNDRKEYGSAVFLYTWEQEAEHHRLFAKDETFVFHNAAFDLAVLSKAYPKLRPRLEKLVFEGKILDTRVLYQLRDPDPEHRSITLAYLAGKLLQKDLEKSAVRTSFRRDSALTRAQIEYAKEDTSVTWQVADCLQNLPLGCFRNHRGAPPKQKIVATTGETNSRHPDVLYSTAAALLAWYLEPQGMEIDQAALRREHGKLSAEVQEMRMKLYLMGLIRIERMGKSEIEVIDTKGVRLPSFREHISKLTRRWQVTETNPPMMMRTWVGVVQRTEGKFVANQATIRGLFKGFAEVQGIEPNLSKKTKMVSLSRDDWKEYYGIMPEVLQRYMDLQRAQKYLSSFLAPLVRANAKAVHASYWIPGAVTMRWSCAKVNLQQVPKKLRHIYRARLGHRFVLADYPTLEMYTLAHTMHCMGIEGPLMETLRSGEDVHTRTAALVFDCDPGRVTPEWRQSAKAANFGLPGGMGIKRFMVLGNNIGLKWTRGDAYRIRKAWFEVYWDVREYLDNFEVNAYKMLPDGVRTEESLLKLGFDPDDTWPSNFELSRALGGLFTCILPTGVTVPDRNYSAAANLFFQSLGAAVITEAFIEACRVGLKPANVMHDSITLEVDMTWPSHGAEPLGLSAKLLAKVMADALVRVCPSVPRPTIKTEVSESWK